jgi:hypothetical protein
MVKSVMEVATKKIVLLALFGLLFSTMFYTNSAKAAVMWEIDNDSLTYSNKGSTGNWQQIYSSAYRYGDARLFSGYDPTAEYDWVINPGNYNGSLNMDVYLNSSQFNNRQANYWYYNPNTGAHVMFKTFDQKYAYSGYGNTLYPPVPFFPNRDNYIWVTPNSATSGVGTGADAVEFWY